MKKVLFAFLLFVLGFALVACVEEPEKTPTVKESTKTETVVPTETKEPLKIDYDELDVSLKVGDSKVLDIKEEVGFVVSDKSVITIDKPTKTVSAVGAGAATITVYLVIDTSVSIEIKFNVSNPTPEVPTETPTVVPTEVLPESIEISKSFDGGILYSDDECILSCTVYPEGASQDVKWRALNKPKATLSKENKVEINSNGEASFEVTCSEYPDVSAVITIKVRAYVDPFRFLDSIQVASSDIVAQDIVATTNVDYDTFILGSVAYFLFEDLVITEYMLPEGAYNRPGKFGESGEPYSVQFITVHDVGGTGDAYANARYCNNPGGREVSWHYTVGNDGIYQQLPDDEMGWHAGDGTWDTTGFFDSGIIATDDEPAKITINQVTGKFQVNGVDSILDSPRNPSGGIVTNTQLPYLGINNYVETNKSSEYYMHYMISKTYWNETYNILSNRGGNLHSIGIESSVEKTTKIFFTWERLAKLVAKLLVDHNITTRDVKQHNSWSGKDCPMTMRRAKRWETFMKYVEIEYYIRKYLGDYKFEFSSDSPYLNEIGMIDSLPDSATEVSYKIKLTSQVENVNYEKEYKVTLPAKSTVRNYK